VCAGVLFAVAWWLWIDSVAYVNRAGHDPKDPQILFYYFLPGIFSTLALIMTNIAPIDVLSPTSWMFDDSVATRVRIWLFASFAISFGALAAGIWIMAAIFMPPNNEGSQWPGIALTLQGFLILISSFILVWARAGRSEEEESLL